jgi:hypothetical protein
MARSLLDSLTHSLEDSPLGDSLDPQLVASSCILGLANDIQAIFGDAMEAATTMFPHKPSVAPARGTLPRLLWPKTVRHDICNIRRRAKAILRLIRHEARSPEDAQVDPSPLDPSSSLWSSVNTSLPLRTVLDLPPKDMDTLGLFTREDLVPQGIFFQ